MAEQSITTVQLHAVGLLSVSELEAVLDQAKEFVRKYGLPLGAASMSGIVRDLTTNVLKGAHPSPKK